MVTQLGSGCERADGDPGGGQAMLARHAGVFLFDGGFIKGKSAKSHQMLW